MRHLLPVLFVFMLGALPLTAATTITVDPIAGSWSVASNGERLDGLAITVNGINALAGAKGRDGTWSRTVDGLAITTGMQADDGHWAEVRLSLHNTGPTTIPITAVNWLSTATGGMLRGIPAKDLRILHENHNQHAAGVGLHENCESWYVTALLSRQEPKRAWVMGYRPFIQWTSKFRKSGERFDAYVDFHRPFPLEPGERIDLDPLLLSADYDLVQGLAAYGTHYSPRMPAAVTPRFNGYNTWEAFLGEASMTRAANLLDAFATLDPVRGRIRVLCLDDGWQITRGDWRPDRTKFPDGLGPFVAGCERAGIIPGVWLAPFWTDPGTVGRLKLVTHGKHESLPVFYTDPSDPALRQYITGHLRDLRAQGIRYFKTDFLGSGYLEKEAYAYSKFHPEHVLREFYQDMRTAMGPDAFWLACATTNAACPGLVDGARIFTDMKANWGIVRWINQATAYRFWMHGNCWISDPDFLLVKGETQYRTDAPAGEPLGFREAKSESPRPGLTMDEARFWIATLVASGGHVMWSDNPRVVNPEGLKLVRLALQHGGGQAGIPLDLAERDNPTTWLRREVDRSYVAFVNAGETPITVSLGTTELQDLAGGVVTDLFANRAVDVTGGRLAAAIPPHGGSLFLVTMPDHK